MRKRATKVTKDLKVRDDRAVRGGQSASTGQHRPEIIIIVR
jgi:hypothetical protein